MVVTDSMEGILADGRVMELMRDIEAVDQTLGDKVKQFFRDICDLLKRTIQAYSNVKPDSAEGRMVQGMQEIYDQLQQLFAEGLYEGGNNYRKAEKNTTAEGSEGKYSLREFEDGIRFVDVQMDAHIFDGMTVSEMNKAVKPILMDKFAGKVIGIDNRAFVNGDSVNEYLHPSKSIDISTRQAKLTAAGELDNLLDAGKALPNRPDGEDGHIHPDAIDFSYFQTIFKVGDEYFEGIVNIKNNKRGKLLKDITKIKNITQDIVSSYGNNPKSNFLRDASMDSIRNPNEIVKENDSAKSDTVKLSARKGEKPDSRMTEADIKAVQSIGRKSINAFSSADIKATERFAKQYWKEMGVKSPFFRAWFGDWRENDQTEVRVASQKGDTRGIQKNTDTGWDIQVSGKVFNETRIHTNSYNISARPYLPYVNDIVQKAVLLDSYGVDPSKPKSKNSLLIHSMYTVADIGNGPEILKLYVEEINNPNTEATIKRAYQLQDIEKYQPTGKSSQKTVSSISPVTTGTIHTVADLFAAVKRMDADFRPNSASKVINADKTPKVMYHGSPAQFTIFDKKKARSSGAYGSGFYFTDSQSHASTYGQQYSVYLNIRNPLQYGGGTVSREQVRKFLEAVAENEDYSIENYGTYDVDSIVQNIIGRESKADAF